MKISLVCLALNLIFATMLVEPLKQGGLGIANTATSLVNVGLLLFALRKKLGRLEMQPLRDTLRPLALATILAGVIARCGWNSWENWFGHETLALKIGAVFVPAGIAGVVYWLAALACKVPVASEMAAFALAKFQKRN
jgi:putative peptidoglycan lipid II flippase